MKEEEGEWEMKNRGSVSKSMAHLVSIMFVAALISSCGLVGELRTEEGDALEKGQARISGRILWSERLGGDAVENAQIFLEDHPLVETLTDDRGRFTLVVQFEDSSSTPNLLEPGNFSLIFNSSVSGNLCGARRDEVELEIGTVIDLGDVEIDE